MGIEPTTSPLPREYSTTELHQHNLAENLNRTFESDPDPVESAPVFDKWSGRRVSNPQPSAWKADTLAN